MLGKARYSQPSFSSWHAEPSENKLISQGFLLQETAGQHVPEESRYRH